MARAQDGEHDTEELRRAVRRAAFLTSGAGIGFGVLATISWILLRNDRSALAAAEDPRAYYLDTGITGSTIAGLYLVPFAAICFLWFVVALRGWIRGTRHRRNMLISDLQLVSAVAFTGVFLISGGAVATTIVVTGSKDVAVTIESLRALDAFGNTLMVVMGVRMAATFVLATSSLGMTTGVLPRWFNILGYVFGLLLMLAPIIEPALTLAFPIWVIALALMLLHHVVNLPEDELPGFAARYGADPEAQSPSPAVGD
jgi:hypothetical protein